jgi:hypothetical protein
MCLVLTSGLFYSRKLGAVAEKSYPGNKNLGRHNDFMYPSVLDANHHCIDQN